MKLEDYQSEPKDFMMSCLKVNCTTKERSNEGFLMIDRHVISCEAITACWRWKKLHM